jgi:uncharacterized membrane protein YtjA (UPF0391 family)
MLSWALTFLVIALIAAFLGFGTLSGTAMYIAQVLIFVFLVLFIISLILLRRAALCAEQLNVSVPRKVRRT